MYYSVTAALSQYQAKLDRATGQYSLDSSLVYLSVNYALDNQEDELLRKVQKWIFSSHFNIAGFKKKARRVTLINITFFS